MTEDDIINNTNDILETGYCQNHYPIKDNMKNKQVDEIKELPETGNYNNPVIRPYRGRCPYNIHPYRKNNIPNRKVLSEPQYRSV